MAKLASQRAVNSKVPGSNPGRSAIFTVYLYVAGVFLQH